MPSSTSITVPFKLHWAYSAVHCFFHCWPSVEAIFHCTMPMFTALITKLTYCLCILKIGIHFLSEYQLFDTLEFIEVITRIALVYANTFLTLVICSTIPTVCFPKWQNTKVIFYNCSLNQLYLFSSSVSCSLLTSVWQRSTETTALDSTSPTEKTRTWLAQHAMPPSMRTWALNRGLCSQWCKKKKKILCLNFFFCYLKLQGHLIIVVQQELLMQVHQESILKAQHLPMQGCAHPC